MAKAITNITEEQFPRAVKYARSLNKRMTVNKVAQRLVLPLGSVLFAAHILVVLLEAARLLVADSGGHFAVAEVLPFVSEYCRFLWEQFGLLTEPLYGRLLLFAVWVYLVPVVVCGTVRVLLALGIRGQAPTFEGAPAEQAKQLYTYVAEGPLPKRAPDDARALWCHISGIPAIACFAAAVAHALYVGLQQEATATWAYPAMAVILLVEAALIYVLYMGLHRLLTRLIKPCYDSSRKWERFKEETERYWLSLDTAERQKREKAAAEEYDGWKYRSIGKSEYYKEKYKEYYAQYTGQPYETEEDEARRIISDVEEELSGGGWGDY